MAQLGRKIAIVWQMARPRIASLLLLSLSSSSPLLLFSSSPLLLFSSSPFPPPFPFPLQMERSGNL